MPRPYQFRQCPSATRRWGHGIREFESTLPRELLPLVTLFRPESASTPLRELDELARYCGLDMAIIVELQPERLVLHELLIRVMTELSVPDGVATGDLGMNFRHMTAALLDSHVRSGMAAFCGLHQDVKARISHLIEAEVSGSLERRKIDDVPPATQPSRWLSLFKPHARSLLLARIETPDEAALRVADRWGGLAAASQADPMLACCYRALHKAATSITARQGSLAGARVALSRVAVAMAANEHASVELGKLLDPLFKAAAEREGFRFLTTQARPIVMNTKGASASGKSTLRPFQRALAQQIGVDWQDFALISPDIWRKFLLDYASLGPARRYAGTLTAQEVEIIDRKLDRYMSQPAHGRGRTTHMLIDRFRFDSFAPEDADDSATQLLTRFGSEVYMFFMITPPEATVERAWKRGRDGRALQGRRRSAGAQYRSLSPACLGCSSAGRQARTSRCTTSSWTTACRKGAGRAPLHSGSNGVMTVLDVERLIDIERFKTIDVEARTPAGVYPDSAQLEPHRNVAFLQACVRRIPHIVFADQSTGQAYAVIEAGKLTAWDRAIFERAIAEPSTRAAFEALVRPPAADVAGFAGGESVARRGERTLGAWSRTCSGENY